MNSIFREFLFKLDILAPFFALLFVLIRVVQKKRAFVNADKALIIFLLLQLVLNTIAGYLQFRQLDNLFIYRLNCLLSHFLFTWYFFTVFTRKKLLYAGLSVFILIEVIIFLYPQTYIYKNQVYIAFPSYSFALSSFILSVYALSLLNIIIEKIPTFHIFSLKEFWFITGILMYFGSAFFIFVSYQYLSQMSTKNIEVLWQVHNIFLALSCIIFLKAITGKQWIRE